MFLLMLTLMSGMFSLVMLMLCLCASEKQPLKGMNFYCQYYFVFLLTAVTEREGEVEILSCASAPNYGRGLF